MEWRDVRALERKVDRDRVDQLAGGLAPLMGMMGSPSLTAAAGMAPGALSELGALAAADCLCRSVWR